MQKVHYSKQSIDKTIILFVQIVIALTIAMLTKVPVPNITDLFFTSLLLILRSFIKLSKVRLESVRDFITSFIKIVS